MGKYDYTIEKAELVKTILINDFSNINTIKTDIDEFINDKRTLKFIEYYNKIVLDHERIKFGTFKALWAIQGMTKEVYTYFDTNFDKIKEEIICTKNIETFFEKHCCKEREEAIFCCKLFHVILPNEFPPIDNPIIKHFKIDKEHKITAYKIIKNGYELFIKEKTNKMKDLRDLLSNKNYNYLRTNELSDFRILDMIYWFKLNRKNSENARSPRSVGLCPRSHGSLHPDFGHLRTQKRG